jgi:hypothetical protein
MACAAAVYATGTLLAVWLPTVTPAAVPKIVPFCAGLMLCRTGNAISQISRQTYVRTLVPVAVRGRATSLMGGTGRVVSFFTLCSRIGTSQTVCTTSRWRLMV